MEGPCFDQSEPILQREPLYGPVGTHHQPAWTMNLEKTTCERTSICARRVVWTLMDTLPSRDQIPKHCWWGKNNLEKEKRLHCLHGMHLKDKKREQRWGIDFHFGQFGVASVSFDNEDEMARHELENEKKKKHVRAFLCEAGHCAEGLYHVHVIKPLWRVRKAWRNPKMELLSGPRPRPLFAETEHLLKHWTLCNFTY